MLKSKMYETVSIDSSNSSTGLVAFFETSFRLGRKVACRERTGAARDAPNLQVLR
jgi:hypothetical protein